MNSSDFLQVGDIVRVSAKDKGKQYKIVSEVSRSDFKWYTMSEPVPNQNLPTITIQVQGRRRELVKKLQPRPSQYGTTSYNKVQEVWRRAKSEHLQQVFPHKREPLDDKDLFSDE